MAHELERIVSDQGNFYAKILYDEYAESPRTSEPNFGAMYCWHQKYNLGDEKLGSIREPWELQLYFIDKKCLFLPIYLHDHSGLRISTKDFSDSWDSGQVGYIFAEEDRILRCFKVDEVTPAIRERVLDQLEMEVEIYSTYLEGDVYCGVIYDAKTSEEVHVSYSLYSWDYAVAFVRDMLKIYEEKYNSQGNL